MTKFVKAVQAYPRLSSFLVLWVLLALSFLYAPAPVVVTEGVYAPCKLFMPCTLCVLVL